MNQSFASIAYPLPSTPPHRDRRTGLILFGVLEVLLGVFQLLMAALVAFRHLLTKGATDTHSSVPTAQFSLIFYLGAGAVFIWRGIGSMQCRRWARTLLLILAWLWLCCGLISIPELAWLVPRFLAGAAATGRALPAGATTVLLVFTLVFTSLFFVLLPGALLLFYRSPHVKNTCEARDPARRWTDRCPAPVLAVACLMGGGALFLLGMSLAGLAVVPFFGILLSGLPGTLLMVAMAGGLGWIARAWYRAQLAGWWALVGVSIASCISNTVTLARVDIGELYRALGYTQTQIQKLQEQSWFTNGSLIWVCLLWAPPLLGYLLWVKRFFHAPVRTAA